MPSRLLPVGVAAAILAGCASAPALGSHLRPLAQGSSAAFDQRVRARFPLDSAEPDVVAELRREHFRVEPVSWPAKVNPQGFTSVATYTSGYYLACELDWTVLWRTENGRISVIQGGYGSTCL